MLQSYTLATTPQHTINFFIYIYFEMLNLSLLSIFDIIFLNLKDSEILNICERWKKSRIIDI